VSNKRHHNHRYVGYRGHCHVGIEEVVEGRTTATTACCLTARGPVEPAAGARDQLHPSTEAGLDERVRLASTRTAGCFSFQSRASALAQLCTPPARKLFLLR
jgi:hypothetical protein